MPTPGRVFVRTMPTAGWFILTYLCVVVAVNLVVAYPTDNDLDEIGWLVANFSFTRLESLANASYPLGFPTLLYFLTPLFGLLHAALIVEAVAMAVVLILSYGISLHLFKNERTALINVVLLSLLVFQTATSEFVDGLCAMLLYGGFFLVLKSGATPRSFLIFGLLVGAASLFRYHYLSFLAVIPIAGLVIPGRVKERVSRGAAFALGLLGAAAPQLVINLLAHGNPFGHHFQNYQIAQHTVGIDWNRFLQTYDEWPLWRIIDTLGWRDFARHMWSTAADILSLGHVTLALILTPVALGLARSNGGKRLLLFMLIAMFLYTLTIILPTRYTDRSLLPCTILAACMLAPCLNHMGKWISSHTHRVMAPTMIMLAILFLGYPLQSYDYISDKYSHMTYNRKILDALHAAGMQDGSEVYSNDWRMYPLTDDKFVTFYNHGGWLLLDSKYAKQRPNPERPRSLPDWEAFFRAHGLKYIVLHREVDNYDEFFAHDLPSQWATIFEDSNFVALAIN